MDREDESLLEHEMKKEGKYGEDELKKTKVAEQEKQGKER